MGARVLFTCLAIAALVLGVQSVFAASPYQAASPTATAGTATAGTAITATSTSTATAVPSPTVVPTPTSAPSPTVVPVLAVRVTPEVLPSGPGLTGRFTVMFSSATPGQGEVLFGTSCNGLVETATQDRHAGTTQHAVIVTGNDLPGTVGDNGIQPGVTYYFEVVTVTSTGTIVDNNNGACYKVTIPTTVTTSSARVLTATLLGANQVPSVATSGTGYATVAVNLATDTVCYTVSVSGITLPATGAHIHKGAAGTNGPIVVPFTAPNASGVASGCTAVSPALAQDIAANPSGYYVNVHTTDFPGGAIRGQLG